MTEIPTASGPPGASAPPRRRGVRGTVVDMVRSLGVLLAAVAVVWLVSGMWHSNTRAQLTVPDWRRSVAGLPAAVGFAVQAPPALPRGWEVTVLRVAGNAAWTMTVTTPQEHYIDLLQTAGDPAAVTAATLPDAVAAGQVRLGAVSWSVFTLPGDGQGAPRRALVRMVPTPPTVLVLSGTATAAELDTFAGALRTVP